MGTPITVTTPNSAETGMIAPVSGAIPAPFEAVMAQVTPATLPTGSEPVESPTDPNPTQKLGPVTALTPVAMPGTMPFTPAQPLPVGMVNSQEASEADLAALMAANQLALRGVAARPPAPPAPSHAEQAGLQITPENFIGPMRPELLTAEPAASVLPSTELPEAAVAPAQPGDADFIGPVMPALLPPKDTDASLAAVQDAHRVAAGESQAESQAEAQSAFIALKAQRLDAQTALSDNLADAAIASRDAVAPLPAQPNLLQPEGEFLQVEHSADEMALSLAPIADDHDRLSIEGADQAVTAASMSALAQRADQGIEKTESSTRAALSQSLGSSLQDERTMGEINVAMAGLTLPIASIDAAKDDKSSAPTQHNVQDQITSDDAEAMAAALLASSPYPLMRQASHNDEALLRSQAPQTPQPMVQNAYPAMPLSRDEALLRVMNEMAPAKTQDPHRAERLARIKQDASPSLIGLTSPSYRPIELNGFVDALDANRPQDAETILKQAVKLANAGRDQTETPSQKDQSLSGAPLIDAKWASAIRDISVVQASAAAEQDKANLAAITAPTSNVMALETVTRDPASLAAVNTDGRRDAKRDADMRQRQMEQQIQVALRAGVPEIRMQLYPPGLGQVMIRLALDGQKLRLSLKADQADANEALAETEAGLRDALSRDGYILAGFDVHDQHDPHHHNRNQAVPSVTPNATTDEGEAFAVDMTV